MRYTYVDKVKRGYSDRNLQNFRYRHSSTNDVGILSTAG